uniref:Uncharacterized protein n=1 Tax=Triticum urartu TaxID=4572 RepID=A0A8R7TSE6_TRIUA
MPTHLGTLWDTSSSSPSPSLSAPHRCRLAARFEFR